MRTHTAVIGVMLAAAAARPEEIKVNAISVLRSERAAEWRDPAGGAFADTLRPKAGHDLLLVTLQIQGAGKVSLTSMKAHGTDGQEYPCVFKSIEETRFDAEGKISGASYSFERTVPFVVPRGAKVAKLVIEGVTLPMASVDGSPRP
jgi:hypothetical protein